MGPIQKAYIFSKNTIFSAHTFCEIEPRKIVSERQFTHTVYFRQFTYLLGVYKPPRVIDILILLN